MTCTDSVAQLGFGRQYRLLKPAEYAEVFAARRVLRGKQFALHYRVNGLTFARLGLVIPKKQAAAAVVRNAIKRQVRETFRQRRSALPSMDLVLRLAGPAAGQDKLAIAGWRTEFGALLDELCTKAVS